MTASSTTQFTYGSLFTGIGGFDLGLDRAGMTCAFQVERDKHCLEVLSRRWPDVPRFNDVKKFSTLPQAEQPQSEVEPIEPAEPACAIRPQLICGGFPCQDISVAGRRAGLAGERSGLWSEFHRILEEFRPRWLLIENVGGLLSSWTPVAPLDVPSDADEGWEIEVVESSDLATILNALAELGYSVAYRVFDSEWFNVAQRRERVFIVGCLRESGGWPFQDERRNARLPCEVLFEREGLPWDSPPSREAGSRVAGTVAASPPSRRNGGSSPVPDQFVADVAPTLNSHFGRKQGLENQHIDNGGGLFVAHTLRAEGFDASEDGTGRRTPLVPIAFDTTQITSAGNYSDPKPGNACHPLAAGMHAPAIAFSSKDDGRDAANDVAPTLRSMNFDKSHLNDGGQVAVAYQCQGSNVGPAGVVKGENETNGVPFIPQSQGVRRLTPRECERLQNFPDDWTRLDSSGSQISDSSRYRMLGNAVTVSVAQWIAARILRLSQSSPEEK